MSETPSPEDPAGPASGNSPRLTVWQVIKSTLAAALGVQTEQARQRDFSQGSAATFIIAGLVFTAAFVLILVVIVSVILSQVG